jgi:hypothetical protein
MRIEWTAPDAVLPAAGGPVHTGQVVDVDGAAAESLVEQGKARKTQKKVSS